MLTLDRAALGQLRWAALALMTTACAAETPAGAVDARDRSEAVGVTQQALLGSYAGAPAEPDDAWSHWAAIQRWHARAWRHRHHRHHDHEPDWLRCGDATLDADEQCDDGNREPNDGCDARCQLEDDASTPGDDRPGYVACASNAAPDLTCSPEQQCCRSPENVCDDLEQQCRREGVTVAWGDDCDGPEDCDSGLSCVRSKYGASCVPQNPQQGYPVLCHSHADCLFLPESGCAPDGVCTKL